MLHQDNRITLSEIANLSERNIDLMVNGLSRTLEIQQLKAEIHILKDDLATEQFFCDYFRHMYYQLLGQGE